MFDRYLGKTCVAVVAFAGSNFEGGAIPSEIEGVLESCDDDTLTLKTKKGRAVIMMKALLVLKVKD
jgi:hypothetical protein